MGSSNTIKSDIQRNQFRTYSNYAAVDNAIRNQQNQQSLSTGINLGKNLYTIWSQNQNLLFEELSAQTFDYIDPESGVAQSVELYKLAKEPGFFENFITPAIDKLNIDRDNILMAIEKELNIKPSQTIMSDPEKLDKFILEKTPQLSDTSLTADFKTAQELEMEAGKGWYDKFSDSIYGKTFKVLNTASEIKRVSEDISSGDVDAGTTGTVINLGLKAAASDVGQKVLMKMAGEEVAKSVASFASGPVGTVLSVLSTLANLSDLSKDYQKAKDKARAEAKAKYKSGPLNPANWNYKGKLSDWT